jgi:predicted amidohydrolase
MLEALSPKNLDLLVLPELAFSGISSHHSAIYKAISIWTY